MKEIELEKPASPVNVEKVEENIDQIEPIERVESKEEPRNRSSKLLMRRKSADPLRIKGYVPPVEQDGTAPNLQLLYLGENAQARPDSSASLTSTATASENTDSGIDSSKASSIHGKTPNSKGNFLIYFIF